jgi:hypothetical protein
MIIGVISDTHGVLTHAAVRALGGVDHILHAGDIGGPKVIEELERIAPVAAVRGNTDGGGWAKKLPSSELLSFDRCLVYLLHDLFGLDLDPVAAGIGVIVSGHTHQAEIKQIGGVLYLNPGSAGASRHGRPLTIARLTIDSGLTSPQIVTLDAS